MKRRVKERVRKRKRKRKEKQRKISKRMQSNWLPEAETEAETEVGAIALFTLTCLIWIHLHDSTKNITKKNDMKHKKWPVIHTCTCACTRTRSYVLTFTYIHMSIMKMMCLSVCHRNYVHTDLTIPLVIFDTFSMILFLFKSQLGIKLFWFGYFF